MQFHAAVVRAGQAAAAQAARFHAEITAIFLHHHVARNFRRAKQAALALVNGKFLGDAVGAGRVVVIPARGQFLEADGVWAVAINLVGAQMDKGGAGSVEPGSFEQVQCADSIRVKIIEGNGGSAVMAGLGGGVDDGTGRRAWSREPTPARARMSSSW